MCTVITSEQKDNPEIAKKNIKVYKIGRLFRGNFIPNYMKDFRYKPSKIYSTKFSYEYFFATDCDDIEERYLSTLVDAQFVTEGFHAFTTLKRVKDASKGRYIPVDIGVFIIPKGAQYYRNPARCIVSNSIIFKNLI